MRLSDRCSLFAICFDQAKDSASRSVDQSPKRTLKLLRRVGGHWRSRIASGTMLLKMSIHMNRAQALHQNPHTLLDVLLMCASAPSYVSASRLLRRRPQEEAGEREVACSTGLLAILMADVAAWQGLITCRSLPLALCRDSSASACCSASPAPRTAPHPWWQWRPAPQQATAEANQPTAEAHVP